jgi:holo-[acyl-carrier protein] synthase
MQLYQGIDLVEMSKFRTVFAGRAALVEDIFTEQERQYCYAYEDPLLHLAARFACKEAAIKALGIGVCGSGIGHIFQEIEVLSSDSGKPGISFRGWTAKISKKRGVNQTTVSISHAGNYCVASVILIGG